MTGKTNSSPIEARQCAVYLLYSREKKGTGPRGESKVNLSKSLLYDVQRESGLDNGLINGTMSRSGRAIIADDFVL